MALTTDLEASLRELASSEAVEVRENGARVATFSALSWELRGAPAKPLLRLWSEQHNLTRQVLAIADHSDERLALAVERFGRLKPGRLEFVRVELHTLPQGCVPRRILCAAEPHPLRAVPRRIRGIAHDRFRPRALTLAKLRAWLIENRLLTLGGARGASRRGDRAR